MKRIIDKNPADDGECRTQEGWNKSFNRKGKAMISAPDVYRAPDSRLLKLREHFTANVNQHPLITSTRIIYNPSDLGARIVHNFGSKVVEPTEISLVVPVYGLESIENLTKGDGLKLLQALFHIEDDASKLIGRLEKITKQDAIHIRILTPDQEFRRNYSTCYESAVDISASEFWPRECWVDDRGILDNHVHRFTQVNCGGRLHLDVEEGQSYGVSVKAEKESLELA